MRRSFRPSLLFLRSRLPRDVYKRQDSGGVVESTFAEGQRVSNGQKIGTVYKGEVSPAVASELNSINTKLSQLSAQDGAQKLAFDDVYKIDSQISARIDRCV